MLQNLSLTIIANLGKRISSLSGVCYKISLLQLLGNQNKGCIVSVACATKSLSYIRMFQTQLLIEVSVACATKSLSYPERNIIRCALSSQWRVLQNLSLTGKVIMRIRIIRLSGVCYKISLLHISEWMCSIIKVSVACATKSLSYYHDGIAKHNEPSQWRVLQNLSLTRPTACCPVS